MSQTDHSESKSVPLKIRTSDDALSTEYRKITGKSPSQFGKQTQNMSAKLLSFRRQLLLFDDGYGSNITWQVIWVQWENEPHLTIYVYERDRRVKVFPMTTQLTAEQFNEHCKTPGMPFFVKGTSRAIVWLLSECKELANTASARTLALNIEPIFSFLIKRKVGHWTDAAEVVNPDSDGLLKYLKTSFCEFGDYNIDLGTRCFFAEIWKSEKDNSQFTLFICRGKGQALVILPDKSAINLWLAPYGRVELKDVDEWIVDYNSGWKSPNADCSAFLWMRSFGLLMLYEKRLLDLPMEVQHFKMETTTNGNVYDHVDNTAPC